MELDTKAFQTRLAQERGIKRGTAAISKAARKGTFGKTARQVRRGRWLFQWPAAAEAFLANTDPTRYGVNQLEPVTVDVVVFESERGRFEISVELHARLKAAAQNDGEDLLTPEMVEALDRILFIVGVVTP